MSVAKRVFLSILVFVFVMFLSGWLVGADIIQAEMGIVGWLAGAALGVATYLITGQKKSD